MRVPIFIACRGTPKSKGEEFEPLFVISPTVFGRETDATNLSNSCFQRLIVPAISFCTRSGPGVETGGPPADVKWIAGHPIIPFVPTSSLGCAICDPVIAVRCFAGGPAILRGRK